MYDLCVLCTLHTYDVTNIKITQCNGLYPDEATICARLTLIVIEIVMILAGCIT